MVSLGLGPRPWPVIWALASESLSPKRRAAGKGLVAGLQWS
jgi:hypothetical protein